MEYNPVIRLILSLIFLPFISEASAIVADSDTVGGTAVGKGMTCSNHFNIGVKTNLLYDAALIPNIGVDIPVWRNIMAEANWMYARWSNRPRRRYWRIYGGDVAVSWQFSGDKHISLHDKGHRLGIYASLACYDFQFGYKHPGALSDKFNYSAGLTYSYSLPISRSLNLGFTLSAGYAWGIYKKHTPIDDHDVWLSTHKLRYWGPTKAAVSLVWVIDIPRHKAGKEAENEN